MKERPILFTGAMVRALLNGSKTQTRRAMKTQMQYGDVCGLFSSWYLPTGPESGILYPNGKDQILAMCPHGQPGDRLWVRESFNPWRFPGTGKVQFEYAADGVKEIRSVPSGRGYILPDDDEDLVGNQNPSRFIRGKRRASIHMPRWASRILLEIVSVRVERLHAISEADAIAEGLPWQRCTDWMGENGAQRNFGPRDAFKSLWESIKGNDSWAANSWVWAIEFKRVAK